MEPVHVPARLARRLAGEPDGGRGWLAALPETLARLAAEWHLEVGVPIEPGGITSVVLPAGRVDGTQAVLKVPVPDDEVAGEPAALRLVDGDGAVRLLAHDAASGALLLEAADAHRSLVDLGDRDAAVGEVVALLRRWWRPVHPASPDLPHLAGVAPGWTQELASRRTWLVDHVPERLVDQAFDTLASVDPSVRTLLHGDLHPGNVLAAEREPWLVIDPKPIVGEPAYDVEPLLRPVPPGTAAVDDARAEHRRFDQTTERLGVERARALAWVVARGLLLGSWNLAMTGRDSLGQLRRATVLADRPHRAG